MTDLYLDDPAHAEEIDLLSQLVIAASRSDEPLSTEQVDLSLGLCGAAAAPPVAHDHQAYFDR